MSGRFLRGITQKVCTLIGLCFAVATRNDSGLVWRAANGGASWTAAGSVAPRRFSHAWKFIKLSEISTGTMRLERSAELRFGLSPLDSGVAAAALPPQSMTRPLCH